MRFVLILSILAALLGGCAIVPAGQVDNRYGYSGDRGYDGRTYRDRDYDRGYNYDRNNSYRHYNNGDPFQEHGH
jgi:hypothetical protein